ncbi:septum site-determining protein MinC [Paenibacillus sabuli]|uniref:septum site-determining protein MinC n=1 Tax=Paenibacillus sabuli TaxID=2772509 RepID=UPI00295BA4B3|nr:septum site-determining protein MinC [Paenibacillus sabuli]
MTEKQHITIKGVKEGLLFLLDDACEFDELLRELKYKLEKSHHQVLTGPLIHIHIRLGKRTISEEQTAQLRAIIRERGNLLVQSIEAEQLETACAAQEQPGLRIISGVVRSGQTLRHDGHLLLTGDVNPGGTISCSGDIYVLGALRGVAHAGDEGGELAIIAAALMRPTQLRIGDVISRPSDEWVSEDAAMEFAYLSDGRMQVDKISQLHRMRKEPIVFKGV